MKFFTNKQELDQFKNNLKQEQCPNPECRQIGYLNCHSIIYGSYVDDDGFDYIKGQRIFCCNTGNRKGCGKTHVLCYSSIIKNRVIQAKDLWIWLKFILKYDSSYKNMYKCPIPFSLRCKVHLLKLFTKSLSRIRSYLCRYKKPPDVQDHNNIIQTILHLKHCFSQDQCAVSQFQMHFQVPFMI